MNTIRDIMTTDVVSVSPETEIADAVRLLLEKGINGIPVVDNNDMLVGVLCQSDLITQQKKIPIPSFFTVLDGFIPLASMKQIEREIDKMTATTVVDAMTPHPVTIGPDATVEEAATLMVTKKFYTIPVVENGKLVGIVGKEDILKTLVGI